MNNCKISKYLAYGMALYTFASIYYLLLTRNIGTPFNDSLTNEQRNIKKNAVDIRKKIFYSGVAIGSIILYITEPFKTC